MAGNVGIRFDKPINGFSFYADGITPDSNSQICFTYGCEPYFLPQFSYNPTTGTGHDIGWYEGKTYYDDINFPDLISVSFNTVALDNLRFESAALTTDGTVPEPGSIALLGLGALGLLAARRRQTAKSQNA